MQALTELLIAEHLMAATRIALILIGHQQSKILSEKLMSPIGVTKQRKESPSHTTAWPWMQEKKFGCEEGKQVMRWV